MPLGTMEDTKDKGWTWILQAPIADVRKAGVHFDPNARTAKAIQGDAVSSSALEVLCVHTTITCNWLMLGSALEVVPHDALHVMSISFDWWNF